VTAVDVDREVQLAITTGLASDQLPFNAQPVPFGGDDSVRALALRLGHAGPKADRFLSIAEVPRRQDRIGDGSEEDDEKDRIADSTTWILRAHAGFIGGFGSCGHLTYTTGMKDLQESDGRGDTGVIGRKAVKR
jgi:hypothetical protein